jgi:glycosyltransferase involved in cell wall biosynthesis
MSENKRIDRLLDSIFNQTYKNFEIIIIDNFSKDNTREVCKTYPVTFIEEKSTISNAWNIGLEHARGQYVLFIDSDMELPQSFLEECAKVIESQSVDCLLIEFTCVESRKASFVNIVEARNMELELGAAPLNIYFYSKDIIGNTRYSESESPLVGEEYIFRTQILEKRPKVGRVKTKILHYYDPSLAWVVRRSWKYGKWFLETKKHLSTEEQVEFIRYNSVLKRDSPSVLKESIKKKPEIFFSFLLYVSMKYVSFVFGYLSSRLG